MNTMDAIAFRRSIRKWKDQPVPRELVEKVLDATIQAPSAKNGQPWRFVVLEGDRKRALTDVMLAQADKLEGLGVNIGSLRWTAKSMEVSPVVVMVYHCAPPEGIPAEAQDDWQFVMLQSTGGAIQTMCLAATEMGLGSLWICDVLYCVDEIAELLARPEGEKMIAAVALGYADEAPNARPRTPWREITDWPKA